MRTVYFISLFTIVGILLFAALYICFIVCLVLQPMVYTRIYIYMYKQVGEVCEALVKNLPYLVSEPCVVQTLFCTWTFTLVFIGSVFFQKNTGNCSWCGLFYWSVLFWKIIAFFKLRDIVQYIDNGHHCFGVLFFYVLLRRWKVSCPFSFGTRAMNSWSVIH